MKPLEIAEAAEHEADDAATYYDRQRAGLGGEFFEELQTIYELIERKPGIFGRFKDTEFRKCKMNRFPHGVFP